LYGGESVAPTFLAEFYGDFGYPGVLFGTSLLGMVYGWVYALGERKDTAYRIYARCLFLQMLVFFPYVNLFSQYVTWILDLCFMYTLLRLSSQTSTVSARRRWTSLAGTLGTEQSI
jgi:oligosaccharide repeat unit polymerase